MKNILLLASQSSSRQKLLSESLIPFQLIFQDANESQCDWGLPFKQLLETIALYKMNHVVLPEIEQKICFVLTADTMGQDEEGMIHGKPQDKKDAIEKIKALRKGGRVGTAFCLDKKVYSPEGWKTEKRIIESVLTSYVFDMPDSWIEKYFEAFPDYLKVSGALSIEDFGAQFLKAIDGSYSTILGLPLFELRAALHTIGFYDE